MVQYLYSGKPCYCVQGLLVSAFTEEFFPDAEPPDWRMNDVSINWYISLEYILVRGLQVEFNHFSAYLEKLNDEQCLSFSQIADEIEKNIENPEFQFGY